MPPPKHRVFSLEELAFFAIPRAWPIIVQRFGDGSEIRDAIIHVDDEPGGLGFMRWHAPTGTWVLTEKGKIWVGARAIAKGIRWAPEVKVPPDEPGPKG